MDPEPHQQTLHSTMFLLIRGLALKDISQIHSFTFHYVSINTQLGFIVTSNP